MAVEQRYLTVPERLAAIETEQRLQAQRADERHKETQTTLGGINTNLTGINKYMNEERGKDQTKSRMWAFGGFVASVIAGLLGHGGSTS